MHLPTKTEPHGGFALAATARGNARRGRGTAQRIDAWGFLLGVVLVALGLMVGNPSDYTLKTRLLALLVIAIGVAPMVRWLFLNRRVGLPIFEIFMLFHAICFGVAGFMPQASTLTARMPVSAEEWDAALVVVAVSLCCTAGGYYLCTSVWPRAAGSMPWPFRFDSSALNLAVPAMLLLMTPLYVFRKTTPLVLQQVTQVVVLFCFLILVAAAFRKEIREPRRSLIIYGLVPANALLFSASDDAGLYGLFSILVPVALTRFTVSRRLPWVLGGLVVMAFVVFQPVKGDYRGLRRSGDAGTPSAIVAFPSLAVERFAGQRDSGSTAWDWFADAFRRLNHLHVTAAIIADTPAYVPYSGGATYAPLVTKLIPRALWPDKPAETQGNAWAQRYGYLYSGDDVTSFNLPFLPEMYMNFGYPGIVVIGFMLGGLMGFVASRLWMREDDSSLIAFGIVIALPFLTPESNLSLMLGRAVISAVVGYFSLVVMAQLLPGMRVSGPRL